MTPSAPLLLEFTCAHISKSLDTPGGRAPDPRTMLEDELIDDKQVALSLVRTGFGHFPIWLRSLNLPEPDSDRPATTMTTIPARLAKPSQLSLSAAEARKRAIRLYRDWCRSVRVPPTRRRLLTP